jgi:adenosylcobinamide-phosphate synthase
MSAPISPGRFLAAYCLDCIAGDPQGAPHPVRMMGQAISAGERWLRRPSSPAEEFVRGAILTGAIAGGSWIIARHAVPITGAAGEVLLAWTTLATRSLLHESAAVLDALDRGDLVLARKRLSMIVGRDTEFLDEPEILRAVIETAAEGLCDGIVAPMLYLVLGGVPLVLAYQAVNTLDSMIGHPEPPYRYFGRAAARLDDFANFIPARVAAIAIVAAAFVTRRSARRAWAVFCRDGDRHPSPNAGQVEAAMAGALDVRLGGMNYYEGKPAPKPVLGSEGRRATRADARAALRIAGVASFAAFSAGWLWLRWRKDRA